MGQTPGFAADYQRPDLAAVREQALGLAKRCKDADSASAFLATVDEWNKLRSNVDTNFNVALVRYAQDTTDEAAKAEQDFWDASAPVQRELDVIHARALLESPYRSELEARYGKQLVALKSCLATTFAPQIRDALAAEARLSSEYQQLMAKPGIEFRGEKLTLSGIGRHFIDADRATRLEAHQARDKFMGDNGPELDRLYDELVTLRSGMGRALGHDSYTPLGYQLMNRASYGPEEVAVFRDAIRTELVPLAQRIHKNQARKLGVEPLEFHDEAVYDAAGNPRPKGNAEEIIEQARQMYGELHPDVSSFFNMMIDRGLLDLELRDGKSGGGFCTNFADQGVPFVFANFNGTEGDIVVVTHECGHAFQCYSARTQPLIEFAFPTYEAAEVHSMGMEYLTYPWMNLFFGDEADRYKRIHLEHNVAFMPYMCTVDHYQHEVYANPSMSPAERNAKWLELERQYLPHRNYGGKFSYLQTGTIWQRQAHIYQMPFYYIDYALAQVCAMQLWMRAESDRDAALKDYLAICKVGGSMSFTDMLAAGNLRSPFDPAVIREVAQHAERVLFG